MNEKNRTVEPALVSLVHWFFNLLIAAAIVVATAMTLRAQQESLSSPAPSAFSGVLLQTLAQQPAQTSVRLTRDEAVRLALVQTSAYQQAKLAELMAAEDVKQARAAFLPRFTI